MKFDWLVIRPFGVTLLSRLALWTHRPKSRLGERGGTNPTGLGWSEMARGPRSVERMIAELRAVLGHVAGGAPAVLVGHSFGAFLVCAYASQYPRDVAGLVLVDPPSDWHDLTPRQAFMLRGGIQLSRVGAGLARVGVVRASLALLTGGAPGA